MSECVLSLMVLAAVVIALLALLTREIENRTRS